MDKERGGGLCLVRGCGSAKLFLLRVYVNEGNVPLSKNY
jgi:hypothetical protein